eukprot:TRINITY_DN3816_c0_g1_i1.p1 TRINITY_DN3816_c0_g1~~TRINITY_DN3816_c0_g1_i1.p1  ORF type:complete len:398 (-),score=84.58 TRINITY_DN3816_c0_g1_i1:39-1232(-)
MFQSSASSRGLKVHVPGKVDADGAEKMTQDSGGLQKQLRKTKFCMYHLQGLCQYGQRCAFAHSCDELQAAPDLKRTRLCAAFAAGSCKDSSCRFAHGNDELRSTDTLYKSKLCMWYEQGSCRNGRECRFAHGTAELRDVPGRPRHSQDARPVRGGLRDSSNQLGQRAREHGGSYHEQKGGSSSSSGPYLSLATGQAQPELERVNRQGNSTQSPMPVRNPMPVVQEAHQAEAAQVLANQYLQHLRKLEEFRHVISQLLQANQERLGLQEQNPMPVRNPMPVVQEAHQAEAAQVLAKQYLQHLRKLEEFRHVISQLLQANQERLGLQEQLAQLQQLSSDTATLLHLQGASRERANIHGALQSARQVDSSEMIQLTQTTQSIMQLREQLSLFEQVLRQRR